MLLLVGVSCLSGLGIWTAAMVLRAGPAKVAVAAVEQAAARCSWVVPAEGGGVFFYAGPASELPARAPFSELRRSALDPPLRDRETVQVATDPSGTVTGVERDRCSPGDDYGAGSYGGVD